MSYKPPITTFLIIFFCSIFTISQSMKIEKQVPFLTSAIFSQQLTEILSTTPEVSVNTDMQQYIVGYCQPKLPTWNTCYKYQTLGQISESTLSPDRKDALHIVDQKLVTQKQECLFKTPNPATYVNPFMSIKSYTMGSYDIVVCGQRNGGAFLKILKSSSVSYHTVQHGTSVNAIDLDPINQKLFTGADDGFLKIWKYESEEDYLFKKPQEIASLKHNGRVWKANLSSDGSLIATASIDGKARVFDTTTYETVCTAQHNHTNVCFAFVVNDNNYLLSGADDGTVRLTAIATNKEEKRLQLAGKIYIVKLNHDKTLAAIGSHLGEIRIWDFLNDIVLFSYNRVDTSAIHNVCLDSQSNLLSVVAENTTSIWNVTTNNLIYEKNYSPKEKPNTCLLTNDGKYFIATSTILVSNPFNNQTTPECHIAVYQQYNSKQAELYSLLFLWLKVKKTYASSLEQYTYEMSDSLNLNFTKISKILESFGIHGKKIIWQKIVAIKNSWYK